MGHKNDRGFTLARISGDCWVMRFQDAVRGETTHRLPRSIDSKIRAEAHARAFLAEWDEERCQEMDKKNGILLKVAATGHGNEMKNTWPGEIRWTDLGRGIHVSLVFVTPEMAKDFLARNHVDQRTISWQTVDAIESDLRANKYVLTHQGACFDANGDTIDGQHRFHGIVKSGVGAWMVLFWNLNANLRDPIDRNRSRSVAFLTSRSTKLTATLAALRSLEAGYRVTHVFTVGESEEFYEHHKDAISKLGEVPGSSGCRAAILAACVWAYPIAPEAVFEFFNKVVNGIMVQEGEPAHAFRNWTKKNGNADGWGLTMAVLNCLKAHIQGVANFRGVHTSAESGYRSITARRRAMKIPNTPVAALVPGPT